MCDGAFYTGRDVAVVGGGDTALQDALFLANSCRHVTLIHRRDQFRGENRLVRQVEKRENITILYSHTVEALHAANGELTGVTVKDVKTGETKELTVEGLFAAVGQQPQSAPFAALVNTAGGYYQAGEDTLTDWRRAGMWMRCKCIEEVSPSGARGSAPRRGSLLATVPKVTKKTA